MANLDESLKNLNLFALLLEQEEEEVEEVEEEEIPFEDEEIPLEDETGEEGVEEEEEDVEIEEEDPTGNEAFKAAEEGELPKPNLNIDEFTNKVARLVNNRDILLKIKDVIINRAHRYLLENYGEKHADMLMSIMRDDFDFGDVEKEAPPAPYGLGANPAGSGITGGGGGA